MNLEYIIISSAISICALILLITSILSYKRYKNKKLVFIILVFLFFLVRAMILSIGLFYEPLEGFISSYYTWLIDLVILNLLYLAALKR